MPPPPHMANMIPVYCIPTTVQQADLGTAQCLAPQEHPGPPQMPPPGVMLPGQQPTFIPQQGKKNIIDKFLINSLLPYYLSHSSDGSLLKLTIKCTES